MRACLPAVLTWVAAGCGGDAAPTPPTPPTAPREDAGCAVVAGFAETSPIAEASGATWLVLDGVATVAVVGDSGTGGAYELLDPTTGAVREAGRLPLGDGASDDLEGLTARTTAAGLELIGVTSSGWLRHWRRRPGGFELVDGPYPLARGAGPGGEPLTCRGTQTNCGNNYEGVCLAPTVEPADGCQGFAASKARGELLCLVADGARLRVDPSRRIAVAAAEALTGCDVAPDGAALWAGTNLFGASRVYRIEGWRVPATARVRDLGTLGLGFPEALAVDDAGGLYRFSDTSGAPSVQAKYACAR
ncbi:MAG: hypothetical protein R2939_15560 [Kofleriaceae bacterium]